MNKLIRFTAAIALVCICFSVDLGASEPDDKVDKFVQLLDDTVGGKPSQESDLASMGTSNARIENLERRIAELERTAIDASEAKEIAEAVVQEYVKELRLAISTPKGGQRIQTVKFSSPSSVGSFELDPGESLVSYSDPVTGRTVRVGGSASSVTTSDVVISSSQIPSTNMRTTTVKPVVKKTYRRGLFGRRISVSSVPSQQEAVVTTFIQSGGPQSCRIDENGNKVCQ